MPPIPRPTVLFVTPFADEREMYAESLRASGFEVRALADASKTPQAARGVSAVVLRVRQHGSQDGIEVTRRLRAAQATARMPIVIISTYVQPEIRATALAAGCDRYLLLPVLPSQLASELRTVINQGGGGHGAGGGNRTHTER